MYCCECTLWDTIGINLSYFTLISLQRPPLNNGHFLLSPSVPKVAVVERFDCISVEEFRIFRSNIFSIDNCSFAMVIMNIFNGLRLEVLWEGPENVRDGRREGIGRIFWDLNGVGVVKEG